jgi:hypothetical protein
MLARAPPLCRLMPPPCLLLPTYFPIVAINPASSHHLSLLLPPPSLLPNLITTCRHLPDCSPPLTSTTKECHPELSSQMSPIIHVVLSPIRNLMFRWSWSLFIVIFGCAPVHSFIPLCLRLPAPSPIPFSYLVCRHQMSRLLFNPCACHHTSRYNIHFFPI